jgi:hypothetical protein
MTTAFLMVLLLAFPPKPDLAFRFKDTNATKLISAARLVGVKLDGLTILGKPLAIEAKILKADIELRGQIVTAKLEGFAVQGDWLRAIYAAYNRRTGAFYIKAYAFDGVVELEGIYK